MDGNKGPSSAASTETSDVSTSVNGNGGSQTGDSKSLEPSSSSPPSSTSTAVVRVLKFPKVLMVRLQDLSLSDTPPGTEHSVPLVSVPRNKDKMNKVNSEKFQESKPSASATTCRKGKGKKNEDLYVYSDRVSESHSREVYGCSFNNCYFAEQSLLLATAGGNHVTVYDCSEPRTLKMLQVYMDEESEHFYTTAWSTDKKGRPIVAAGGVGCIIRLMDFDTGECSKYLAGHGEAINELKFHPREPMLLFSASEDNSIRMWNVYNLHCVVCFRGFEGHMDQVLTLDITLSGDYLISGGMDHFVRFWSLRVPIVTEAIKKSRAHRHAQGPFPTVWQSCPRLFTNRIHNNYVDCVRSYGGKCVVSRSACSNEVVFWKPAFDMNKKVEGCQNDGDGEEEEEFIMCKFQIEFSHHWFMRFGMNLWQTVLGIGNALGKVHIFDLQHSNPENVSVFTMKHPQCDSLVRQVAISIDGSVIVYVCDDGTVWRWDKNTPDLPPIPGTQTPKNTTGGKYVGKKRNPIPKKR